MGKRSGRARSQAAEGKRAKARPGKAVGAAPASRVQGSGSRLRVPPPDSEIWPEEYRGANWRPAYAFIFAGKCQLCVHSCPLPRSRQLRDKWTGTTRLLQCTNHPACPGEIAEVLPTDTCRNFKLRSWPRRKAQAKKAPRPPSVCKPGPQGREIRLTNGMFALVDAADCEGLSRHRWYATRRGRNLYAITYVRGRTVYMHRMIMKPRWGYIVHHHDHNGLNNQRYNLRVCTQRQHQASRGPDGGASRFVGVYRHRDKWFARIRCRGKIYYLGTFDDEIAAAKARDRKAYELHGQFAYLNFPEDYGL